MNLRRAIRWRRTVTPGFVTPPSVKIHRRTENGVGCGHQTRNAAAHTKSHDAQSTYVRCCATAQKLYRGIHIIDDPGISTTARAFLVVGINSRRVSMVEVGSDAYVAGFSDAARHLLGKLGNTILILYNNDGWN